MFGALVQLIDARSFFVRTLFATCGNVENHKPGPRVYLVLLRGGTDRTLHASTSSVGADESGDNCPGAVAVSLIEAVSMNERTALRLSEVSSTSLGQ